MSISVSGALSGLTLEQLKEYAAVLTTKTKPTRKAELISLIDQQLKDNLGDLWEKLDETQQLAVSETLHSDSGVFDTIRFKARYGSLPVGHGDRGGFRKKPSLLRLFLYDLNGLGRGLAIPEDIKADLRILAAPPTPAQLETVVQAPEFFERIDEPWRRPTKNAEVTLVPTVTRNMEQAAQQDLQTVLRLIAKGKVSISDKTFRPTAATAKEIASLLSGGDFYESKEKVDKWDQQIGPIKAFAWPLLLQAARLAEVQGNKLGLTKSGLQALNVPACETLRLVWQRWLKTSLLDEFQRVDEIKGQGGKGGRSMTALEGRRAAIIEALRQCPVDRWVTVEDFSCFMQASGIHFEVASNIWNLYISDPNYGCLGNQGDFDWAILQGRYVLCFLFEYAATLGLIDVVYIPPDEAPSDYADLWGADGLAFLSRYDGLIYFRLNALGAYCLGIADGYKPGKIQARASVTVLPSLQINVVAESLSPECALLLGTYADQESPSVWRLSRNKALTAVESGHQIAELRDFLQSCDEQPLPETVEAFINLADKQARALQNKGLAILIECVDGQLADVIANHKCTKTLCQRAGKQHLAVPVHLEDQFRKAVNILGYGMPKL